MIAEPEPEIEFDQSGAWRKEIVPSLWERLCVRFGMERIVRKLLPLQGGERRREGFFRDSRLKMGLAPGKDAESILTWVVEFPILLPQPP
jgi:hypothetical protein